MIISDCTNWDITDIMCFYNDAHNDVYNLHVIIGIINCLHIIPDNYRPIAVKSSLHLRCHPEVTRSIGELWIIDVVNNIHLFWSGIFLPNFKISDTVGTYQQIHHPLWTFFGQTRIVLQFGVFLWKNRNTHYMTYLY